MTEKELIEFKSILAALKKILRERGISYADLAQKVGLSESGIKKIFGSRDCSYGRLSQIAKALGLRMVDLLDEIDRSELRGVQFSPKQQDYFLKNIRVFRFFVKLVVERQSISEIQKEFQLKEKDIFSLLKKLDDIGLVQLLPKGEVKLPRLSLVKDFGPGPLLSKIYQEWGQSIVHELAHPKFQGSGQFIVRCLKMKEDTYQELLARLLEIEKEFLKRAVREMSVSTLKLKSVRWIWMTDDQSFIKGAL